MPTAYKSSIPVDARERVTRRYTNGAKETAEYRLKGEHVGLRQFHETGELAFEYALKGGKKHGLEYRWDSPGKLLSVEPFVDGLLHGTIRQWNVAGRSLGTYRMIRGTGLDLWRQEREDKTAYLAEAIYLSAGMPHGFEWWIEEDQRRVYIERHHRHGQLHGIYREWNDKRRLRRGFPQYYIAGAAVAKRQYLRASALDSTLPRFKPSDNQPRRKFPPEVALHLQLPQRTR